MANFVTTFIQGQQGLNNGSTTGILGLDRAINKLQKGMVIGLAAGPKVGKTTFCDFAFILSAYLEAERNGTLDDIEWIYLSYEIARISKEFKFAAFFLEHDFGYNEFKYKGVTYKISSEYLQGKMIHIDDNGNEESIKMLPEHEEALKIVYTRRIIPLFGVYNEQGEQLEKGKITFFEDRDNPTGIWKYLVHVAERNGKFIFKDVIVKNDKGENETVKKIAGYTENNPKKKIIIITDHVRRLKRERGFTMKENIDKHLEYCTDLRKICNFTFIHIVHSNRGISNVERLKFHGEDIFPTADDTKDSGNFAEECTILMTLFNANDEKYNLEKHMGVVLAEYPNYRSLHITESRDTECPVHIRLNMYGNINKFEQLTI
jgi:hypothetical protein